MDAGIQSQGCESSGRHQAFFKYLRNRQVTVHGTGFRHPCRNDELSISALAHNDNCRKPPAATDGGDAEPIGLGEGLAPQYC